MECYRRAGFHVIIDLSDCTFGNLNTIGTFRKIMDELREERAGQVIRITRLLHKPTLNRSARLHGYKPVYVRSLEGENILARHTDKQDLQFLLCTDTVHLSSHEVMESIPIRHISTADYFTAVSSGKHRKNRDRPTANTAQSLCHSTYIIFLVMPPSTTKA